MNSSPPLTFTTTPPASTPSNSSQNSPALQIRQLLVQSTRRPPQIKRSHAVRHDVAQHLHRFRNPLPLALLIARSRLPRPNQIENRSAPSGMAEIRRDRSIGNC